MSRVEWTELSNVSANNAFASSTNQHHQIQLSTHCLPYIRLPKAPDHYIFTLQMATAVFAKTWIILIIRRGSSPKVEVVVYIMLYTMTVNLRIHRSPTLHCILNTNSSQTYNLWPVLLLFSNPYVGLPSILLLQVQHLKFSISLYIPRFPCLIKKCWLPQLHSFDKPKF
jgi:hypothetical protein